VLLISLLAGTLALGLPTGALSSVQSGKAMTVYRTLGVGGAPYDLALDPVLHRVYVAVSGPGAVYGIGEMPFPNGNNQLPDGPLRTLPPGRTVLGIAAIPSENLILVPSYPVSSGGTLTAISSKTGAIEAVTNVGDAPYSVADDPTLNEAFVLNHLSNTISVVSDVTHQVLRAFRSCYSPLAIAVNAKTGVGYCTGQSKTGLLMFNTRTGAHLKTVRVPYPDNIAVDSTTDTVYVTTGQAVVAVSGASGRVIRTHQFGNAANPIGIAVDSVTHDVFVTLQGSDELVTLAPGAGKQLASVQVGGWPETVIVDPVRQMAFVGNTRDNTVSLVSLHGV
jgi:DNA-binding beta-propeller fold protein YncE